MASPNTHTEDKSPSLSNSNSFPGHIHVLLYLSPDPFISLLYGIICNSNNINNSSNDRNSGKYLLSTLLKAFWY